MPNFLNLTLPIKQDADSQKAVSDFLVGFETTSQPAVNGILLASRQVHFARAIAIRAGARRDDTESPILFLQVITEYDTPFDVYSNFFADYLPTFFAALFKYVEDGIGLAEIKDPEKLLKFIKSHDLYSLGEEHRFAAYPQTVIEIQDQFGIVTPPLPPLNK